MSGDSGRHAYLNEARDILRPAIENSEDGLPIDEAIKHLEEHSSQDTGLSLSIYDPEEICGRLLDRGYLYEVNGRVKIP